MSEPDDPIKAAVDSLRADDDRWHVVPAAGMTTLTRAWPDGTVDTLMLLSPDTAYAFCEDPQGGRPWSMRGTLEQIVGHARALVAPDRPERPRHQHAEGRVAMNRDSRLAVRARRARGLARRLPAAAPLRPEWISSASAARRPRGLRALRLAVHASGRGRRDPAVVPRLFRRLGARANDSFRDTPHRRSESNAPSTKSEA